MDIRLLGYWVIGSKTYGEWGGEEGREREEKVEWRGRREEIAEMQGGEAWK